MIIKTFFPISVLLLFLTLLLSCTGNSPKKNDLTENNKAEEKLVKITIEGMSCMSCVANVKSTISDIEGVNEVDVSLQDKNATILYDPDKVTIKQIKNAVIKLDYKVGNGVQISE